jgi:hypothetical protein
VETHGGIHVLVSAFSSPYLPHVVVWFCVQWLGSLLSQYYGWSIQLTTSSSLFLPQRTTNLAVAVVYGTCTQYNRLVEKEKRQVRWHHHQFRHRLLFRDLAWRPYVRCIVTRLQVNNAGVNFNKGADNSVEFAEQVIKTNYYGTKRMIDAMIPLMKHSPYSARIVNVSSRLGRANGRRNVSLFNMFLSSHCDLFLVCSAFAFTSPFGSILSENWWCQSKR